MESSSNDNGKVVIRSWKALERKHEMEMEELEKKMKEALIGKKGAQRDDTQIEWNEKKMDLLREQLYEKRELEELEDRGELVEEEDEKETVKNDKGKKGKGASAAGSTASQNGTGEPQPKPKSKAQKKREKEEEQMKKRIEEIKSQGPSQKQIEIDAIKQKIAPYKLRIVDISADGNCLYSAIADQMRRKYKSDHDYKTIRMLCADYLKSHRADFEAFFAFGAEGDGASYDAHVNLVRNSSEWGGQLEISAISHALKQPIHIYSANEAVIKMGEEYESDDPSDPPLRLSFHRSYYALGNHYNSIAPI